MSNRVLLVLFGILATLNVRAAMPADRPLTLFFSTATVNQAADTITLPLRQGALADGTPVWFVLSEASDKAAAQAYGIGYSPDLADAAGSAVVRSGTIDAGGKFTFAAGRVDFSPVRQVVPGDAPDYFPPKVFQPGSTADAAYSPLVRVGGSTGVVYNAPIIAFGVTASQIDFCGGNVDYSLVHDKVASICPSTGQVTLTLSHGFASGKEVVYFSTDASVPLAAALEAATYAPSDSLLRGTGATDDIYAFVNGATGKDNPERQGFDSALAGDGGPLNMLDGLPGSGGYSPLWDLTMGVWTEAAVTTGTRMRLTSSEEFLSAALRGDVTGPGGAALAPAGILINCPIVGVFE